jgi:hypothetical protein
MQPHYIPPRPRRVAGQCVLQRQTIGLPPVASGRRAARRCLFRRPKRLDALAAVRCTPDEAVGSVRAHSGYVVEQAVAVFVQACPP